MIRIPWRIPIVAGLVVTLIAGSYFTGRSAGTTACTAERQQHELALADLWRAEVARRQAVANRQREGRGAVRHLGIAEGRQRRRAVDDLRRDG